jgi:hypothetical protein
MSLWLLEAKPFPEDTRSAAATSQRVWLSPGTYTVGRKEGQCDIAVEEDKSISRLHAEITVPSIEELGEPPSITILDKSKYGTYVTSGTNLQPEGEKGTVQKVEHRWLVKFGYQSPYRVKKMGWNLLMHPSCSPETLKLATKQLGFNILTTIDDIIPGQTTESATYLIMPSSKAPIDGFILHAMMPTLSPDESALPIVSAEWLLKWKERKVWKNSHPKHEEYPVDLELNNGSGVILPQESILEKLIEVTQKKPLENLKFLFKPCQKERTFDQITIGLEAVTASAGGKVVQWPATKSKAPKRGIKSYVLVLPSPPHPQDHATSRHREEIPAWLQNFKWITQDSLTLAIMNGSDITEYIVNPEENKGVSKQTVPDSDEETEVMDVDQPVMTLVVDEEEEEVATKKAKQIPQKYISRATRANRKADVEDSEVEKQEEESKKRGRRKTAASTAAAADSPAPKRQRAQGQATTIPDSQDNSIAAGSPSSVHPSPPKRARKAAATKTAPEPAATAPGAEIKTKASKASKINFSPPKKPSRKVGEPAAVLSLPPGDGWKMSARRVQKDKAKEKTTTTAHPASSSADIPAPAPEPANNSTTITTAATAVSAAPSKEAVDASAIIVDKALIVVPFIHDHEDDNGYIIGAGFKAFRRKGSAVGYGNGGTARLPRIPFDPEPYREGATKEASYTTEFLKEEAEKEAAMEAADELFDANLKPTKDKKALEKEKKKLLSMLPAAARRGLE